MSHRIERSAEVGFSCEQMFELVNDIEAYPDYMDGCQKAEILKRGDDWLEARLALGLGGISQSFVTRNQLERPERMTMELVDGPFRRFSGEWRFETLAPGCRVTLELDFSLKNPLLAMAVNKMFEQIAGAQVRALCRRAEQVYG
ncbi:type II toxin-antitoxin system RatA family toxin [Gilvimarinus algae]|uniref:Type II toxin-antitoxin system RatA family toxin n=1 Tax=Gilvimarinus algae TaxID=3058037 RepID=A0ABT8TJM1_9GAMM|nr:type II toxin-antitoxin system RatA family toxin [Gilvimarinus sp. SDUM040014]MDO3383785.1 type II toxin-antitoxin system RatA family toxin [Gilvimarinus sp. SDUM040014]